MKVTFEAIGNEDCFFCQTGLPEYFVRTGPERRDGCPLCRDCANSLRQFLEALGIETEGGPKVEIATKEGS